MNLLPAPRSLKTRPGSFLLPKQKPLSAIKVTQTDSAPNHPEGYALTISKSGIEISFREISGLRAAVATLRQLLREYGRRLPCLKIRDWPDFLRRGVMLDISRGRVPKLETLLDLVEQLANFKINEFQLYTEHTFAYRRYKSVWKNWGALTAKEIQTLDARCRELGIDLVPNQNSFGHLRYFLEDPRLKKLAEISQPYEDPSGEFVRRPTTLAPNHPGTLPFLRGLYDELLPNFRSRRREEADARSPTRFPPPHVGGYFNVGCDETWDLGRGQSKKLCEEKGKGRVYLDFLKKIHREVSKRGKRMQFWGDIILHHPELIKELPDDVVALNWGYEANHPFAKETARFAKAKIPFYVCPGTSTWMTMVGKHDNALANLRAAAEAGKKSGARGYLNTDWGDGGHPQPLAVSWLPFVAGAALSWNAKNFDEARLIPVLSRDIFSDPTQRLAKAALALGRAHRKLKYSNLNSTPLGSVIAAPPLEDRELFCRDGLKCFARISGKNIRATWKEIEAQRKLIARAQPATSAGKLLARELDLAARMAAESCRFLLWQQALAGGATSTARQFAQAGRLALRQLAMDFEAYWPARNKGSTKKCSPFLRWRAEDYRKGALPGHR